MAAPEFAALFSRRQTAQYRYSQTSVDVTGVPDMLTPAGANPLAPHHVRLRYGMDAVTGDVRSVRAEVVGARVGRWAQRSYWTYYATRRLSFRPDRELVAETDCPEWLRWLVLECWPEVDGGA